MALTIPDTWKPHNDDILLNPGVVVVTGAVDTGKTSLCTVLVNRAIQAGVPVAVIDCDLGQCKSGRLRP